MNNNMGLGSNRFKTGLVVFAIGFAVLVMMTLMYQNSIFDIFGGVSKDKVPGTATTTTTPHNVTAETVSAKPNVTLEKGLGGTDNNKTISRGT